MLFHRIFNSKLYNHVEELRKFGVVPDNWIWYKARVEQLNGISEDFLRDIKLLHDSIKDEEKRKTVVHLIEKLHNAVKYMMSEYSVQLKDQKTQAEQVNDLAKHLLDFLTNVNDKKIKLSFTRNDLNAVMKNYSIEALINLFRKDFGELLASDVGVWEKYTLEQHNIMVLTQFDKYFSHKTLPAGMTTTFLRTFIMLHDIGKPDAVKAGNNKLQHKFTLPIIKSVLQQLNFSDQEILISLVILDGDPLGSYIRRGGLPVTITANKINAMAMRANLSLKDFFELLLICYMCDASSYTEDSCGVKSLEWIFEFDHKNRALRFSEEVTPKILELRKILNT